MNILIVGAGFSGAVIAQELARTGRFRITIIEARDHIGGNCYTARDPETNVMEHVYGPHIFNTNSKELWDYVNRFGELVPFTNRVKAVTDSGVFSLPINLLTINQLFQKDLDPREAEAFIKEVSDDTITHPANFEEQALHLVGRKIYETFFKGYTKKQWGCDPKELPADILKRLPIRFNYDDNYYNSRYQGIPKNGYTQVISNMMDHPAIEVRLRTTYYKALNLNYDYVFYTGPIDAYFDYERGRLGYRTIFFERGIFDGHDYQGNAVLNYCDGSVPYTRIHEHKHFAPWEDHAKSLYLTEYSKETTEYDIPFYPKSLSADITLLKIYQQLAEAETSTSFLGRLGTYRYLDMQHVIEEALAMAAKFINHQAPLSAFDRFSFKH